MASFNSMFPPQMYIIPKTVANRPMDLKLFQMKLHIKNLSYFTALHPRCSKNQQWFQSNHWVPKYPDGSFILGSFPFSSVPHPRGSKYQRWLQSDQWIPNYLGGCFILANFPFSSVPQPIGSKYKKWL